MIDPMQPFAQADARRLLIFGHPGHELALFGVIQHFRPSLIVITDGGSARRVDQSRAAIESIGALDRTTYLNYEESAFYAALLNGDITLFHEVARRLQSMMRAFDPHQVFCDAIEFYNPVHDITYPIVRSALTGMPGVVVYEVPLVYQKTGIGEAYEIQRVPDRLASRRVVYDLTSDELQQKAGARTHTYTLLHEQAGPEFLSLTHDHLRREEVAVSDGGLPSPRETDRVLRYEWRARLLHEQGLIEREVTFAGHYLPIAQRLLADNPSLA